MAAVVSWTVAASIAATSLPQSLPPIPLVAAEQPPVPETLHFGNVDRRMTVRVSIADRGPYEFIVDTGAERTVVSHDLANLLGLKAGRLVRVTAMTNAALVGTVVVPALNVNRIAAYALEAPALNQNSMGAPGMLGLDALRGHAVSIDFDHNEMSVVPSNRLAKMITDPNDIVVTAKSRFGQLIVTDAHYHNRRVSVVVDTGTPVTVANSAFLALLGKSPKSLGQISMISALGETMIVDYVEVDRLEIGGVGFNHVPLAIADAEPFRRFGLTDQPALLLGMDALRLFRQVDIDFANRRIRFSMPSSMQVASN